MMGVITIIAIIFGGTAIITLGSIWMGIHYQMKKKGLTKGASEKEINQIRQDISQIANDLSELKKQVADLIIMVDNLN